MTATDWIDELERHITKGRRPMNRIARTAAALTMTAGLLTAAPTPAQADAPDAKLGTWDCAPYSYDNNSAFRRCSDSCATSGEYAIRVKLSQYVGGGQVEYRTKDGNEQQIGSGQNFGSLVSWNAQAWDLVWIRMVGGSGINLCYGPIKYP